MPSLNTLERMIEEELDAMHTHQVEEEKVGDPKLKFVFHKLAELRGQGIVTLQSYLNEVRPIAEVTRQINEMF